MELRLLRAFVAVADAGTYGRAADRIGTTQPAVTKQIQQLERMVGTPVLVRGRQGAALTEAGRTLLADARELVRLADRFETRMRRVAGGEVGLLTVGFGLSSILLAPRAVAEYRRRFPDVAVRLEDMSSAAQVEGLRSGSLDVAFLRLPGPPDLRSVALHVDALAVARLDGTPPPRDDEGLARWLDDRPLIRLSPGRGPGLHTQVDGLLAAVGARPRVVQHADDLQTVLALVAAGLGVALVPASAAAISPATLAVTRLEHASARWTVGLAWDPRHRSPLLGGFLDEVARLAPSPRGNGS